MKGGPMSTERDEERGLYRKYEVRRLNDIAGKHRDCIFFVLDLDHDASAIPAIRAYADACEAEFPKLAEDLRALARGRAPESPAAASEEEGQ